MISGQYGLGGSPSFRIPVPDPPSPRGTGEESCGRCPLLGPKDQALATSSDALREEPKTLSGHQTISFDFEAWPIRLNLHHEVLFIAFLYILTGDILVLDPDLSCLRRWAAMGASVGHRMTYPQDTTVAGGTSRHIRHGWVCSDPLSATTPSQERT